jgi:hypothetical protein
MLQPNPGVNSELPISHYGTPVIYLQKDADHVGSLESYSVNCLRTLPARETRHCPALCRAPKSTFRALTISCQHRREGAGATTALALRDRIDAR